MDEQKQALEELRIIRQMMERTTRRWTGEGWVFWIIWGVGGILASGISEILTETGRKDLIPIPWTAYWIVCIPLTLYFSRREWNRHGRRPMSFIDKTIGMVWGAIGVSFLLTALASGVLKSPDVLASTFVTLAGAGVFITGALGQERVLYAAGALWWCGAVVAMFFPQHTGLIQAALMLFGYLLPGYIIKSRASRGGDAAAEPAGSMA
jgi:hypothetical protein